MLRVVEVVALAPFLVLLVVGWRTPWNVGAFTLVTFALCFLEGSEGGDLGRGLYFGLFAAPQGAITFFVLRRKRDVVSGVRTLEKWVFGGAAGCVAGSVGWAVSDGSSRAFAGVLLGLAALASSVGAFRARRRARTGPQASIGPQARGGSRP